jgi:NADPH-dependent 2,4-dienoyl-CoA reductase/sulfur reductase-like enzyme/nitrite reductase/ring-hydroxylating ferredoxin subunit
MLRGHAEGEPVLLARVGGDVFAIGATCTHYGAPLNEGLLVGDTVRCPWHHACFSLRSGVALRPPALNDVRRWKVEVKAGRVVVRGKLPVAQPKRIPKAKAPASILILGAGATGAAAAETLRREGFRGEITMVDPDPAGPVDRPNLSKDYLAGNAPEDWLPLRAPDWYAAQGIELVLGKKATLLDAATRTVRLDDGSERTCDALLLATGADPIRPPIPAAGTPVFYLRTLADARAIIAAATKAKRAAIVGAGFIGLEVAASLKARGLDVHVIAPEAVPLERVMGKELGAWIRSVHVDKGVVFHLGESAKQVTAQGVVLGSGATVAADFVVVGVGVRPNDQLAQAAGLTVEKGIVVNEFLETSAPGIWAAGDVARWPDPVSGQSVRVEHWVVAERQGQCAARNMLGRRERYHAVPFFWSQHFDVSINYVGHAEQWDEVKVEGDLAARDASVRFVRQGRTLAVATVWRDQDSLKAELDLEGNER